MNAALRLARRGVAKALVDAGTDGLAVATRAQAVGCSTTFPAPFIHNDLPPVHTSCSYSLLFPPICRRCASSASTSGPASSSNAVINPSEPSDVANRLMIDTLALMKKYEQNGLSRGQAEALTRLMTDVILSVCSHNDTKFITKVALERMLIELRAQQQHQGQELVVQQQVHLAGMSKDTERLQAQLDKFKADIKHDVDKLTANQKLDLNLERGRLRDELQQVRDKVIQMNSDMDKEVNSVRTQIESAKSDTLKWVVVTVGGLLGAGLAAIRLSLSM